MNALAMSISDLRSEDKEVLSFLDIIGSAVVDNFYNHLYDKAIHLKERSNSSITECYRIAIGAYLKNDDSSMFYKNLIESIQFYTKMTTCYDDISYVQCINMYARLFVPDQYFASMTESQKTNILFMILKESIKEFSVKVVSSFASSIIDDHLNSDNVVMMQNSFLEILMRNRANSYSKFIQVEKASKPKPSIKGVKSNQSIINFAKKYKQCVTDYDVLKKKYNSLKSRYDELSSKGKDIQQMFLDQINKHKKTESELEAVKRVVVNLQAQLSRQSQEKKMPTVEDPIAEESSSDESSSDDQDTSLNYSNEFSFDTTPMYMDDDA